MNISEVCKKYGISPHTLRYYERIGLIPSVTRNSAGVRDFSERDCGYVHFVMCMRTAGVQIDPLKEYLRLMDEGPTGLPARKTILQKERDRIAQNIAELTAFLEKLDYKILNYENHTVEAQKKIDPASNGSRAANGHQDEEPKHRSRA
jgi:DNA-binding transcriptional MerR regulator